MKNVILIALVLLGGVFSFLWVYCGTFQIVHPQYMYWVYFGTECPKEYLEKFVFEDFYKTRIIKGLSLNEIKTRFPGIVDGDSFPKESYRGKVLENWRKEEYKNQTFHLYWFDNDPNTMGWAISLLHNKGYQFLPIKG